MEALHSVSKIIIHHTQTTIDHPVLIRRRHKFLRGREDIGYHFVIGNGVLTVDGKLYQGRSTHYQGAHVFGYNSDSLAVALIGNFDNSLPSTYQLAALHHTLLDLLTRYSLSPHQIFGHCDYTDKKTCPGKKFPLQAVRNSLYEVLHCSS